MKAVLLDALGTLVELEPPWPALVGQLQARGVTITEDDARDALLAEMRHYRERCHLAADRDALAALRAQCTEVLRAGLPAAAQGLPAAELQAALLGSLLFRPYPEVPAVLARLRRAGMRLVVVSNWDVSLHDVLAATGLDGFVDGVVTSAEAGVSKPDAAIFATALAVAGVGPDEALHVGDSVDADVVGAQCAGVAPVLIAREGAGAGAPAGVAVIESLRELPELAQLGSEAAMSTLPPVDEPAVTPVGEPVEPELDAQGAQAWPPWSAFVALIAGLGVALFGALVIGVFAAAFGADFDNPPAVVNILATIVQDAALVGSAVLFARMQGRARPGDFGLRPTRARRAIKLVLLTWGAFLLFSAAWVAVLGIDQHDDLPKELGVDEGAASLLAVAALVSVVAPIAEEVFFRGYFFTALRNWRGVWPAAAITGAVFGVIHAGSSPVGFLAPLALLGFLLCLLYVRTGSLYPCIVLHSLNNSVAFGVGEHWGWQIAVLAAASLAVIGTVLIAVQRVVGESLGWFPWGARGV